MRRWITSIALLSVIGLLLFAVGRVALSLVERDLRPDWRAAGTDTYGDPKPEGAVARMGTLRFRRRPGGQALWQDDRHIVGEGLDREIVVWDAETGARTQALSGHRAPIVRPPERWSFRQVKHVLAGGPAPTHADDIDQIALLPGGGLVSAGQSIRAWNLTTGEGRLVAHPRGGNVLGFTLMDENRTLVYEWTRKLRRFDLESGDELPRIDLDFEGDVAPADASTDGETLACLTLAPPQRLLLIATRTGEVRYVPPAGDAPESRAVRDAAFGADGRTLWAVTSDGDDASACHGVVAIDLDTLAVRQRWDLPTQRKWVALEPSPDGKLVAVTDLGGRHGVFDAATGDRLWESRRQGRNSGPLAFSPDGTRVVAPAGRRLAIRDALTGATLVDHSDAHVDRVVAVTFSVDGQTLVSASADRSVRGWETETGALLWTADTTQAWALARASDPGRVTVAREHAVAEIDVDSGRLGEWRRVPGHVQVVVPSGGLMWHVDRGLFVQQGADGPARPMTRGASPLSSGPPTRDVLLRGLAWQPEADRAITLWEKRRLVQDADGPDHVTTQRVVRLVDSVSGDVLWQHGARSDTIAAIGPDGAYVAVGDGRGHVVLYDAAGTRLARRKRVHDGHQHASPDGTLVLCFSPDGTLLASGGADGAVRLWSIPELTEVKVLRGHEDAVYCLAFSPDGTRLASGSADTTILVWDVPRATPSVTR